MMMQGGVLLGGKGDEVWLTRGLRQKEGETEGDLVLWGRVEVHVGRRREHKVDDAKAIIPHAVAVRVKPLQAWHFAPVCPHVTQRCNEVLSRAAHQGIRWSRRYKGEQANPACRVTRDACGLCGVNGASCYVESAVSPCRKLARRV